MLHATHYTTGFSPEGRYPVGKGALAAMFEGEVVRLPRAWLGRLFRRAPAPAAPAIAGGSD